MVWPAAATVMFSSVNAAALPAPAAAGRPSTGSSSSKAVSGSISRRVALRRWGYRRENSRSSPGIHDKKLKEIHMRIKSAVKAGPGATIKNN